MKYRKLFLFEDYCVLRCDVTSDADASIFESRRVSDTGKEVLGGINMCFPFI
jgi:hypothetical protein